MTVINLDVKQQPGPNDRDGHGRTRLHNLFYGLFQCELSELQKALKAGCDVNAADNWGDTPLHTLIGSIMNDAARADLMRALIEAGANVSAAVNTRDRFFETPLGQAERDNNFACAQILREHGAYAGIAGQIAMALRRIIGKPAAIIPAKS